MAKADKNKPKMNAVPKSKSKKGSQSHIKNGDAYFKHTGRYNEVTTAAMGQFKGSSVGD